MDNNLYKERMSKFEGSCRELDAIPELIFARGKLGGKDALILLSGPTMTRKLIAEIRMLLDERERALPLL